MTKNSKSKYWSGLSTVIRDGEKLKTANYEYTVLNLINDGASIVYKARRSDNKIIFLKQFKEPMKSNLTQWKDFIEFQYSVLKTLLKLPTSIVEKNYEYFEFKDVHFHAKSFEEGCDLNEFIYNKKADFKTRLHIAKVAMGILKIVHQKGVVHSDLKPQQFFIVDNKKVSIGFSIKLIDFDHCVIPELDLYRPAGTDGWKSPEHIKNANVGYHSDVFSMGQIIYTLLTGGRQPYKDAINNDTYNEDIFKKKGYVSLNTLFKGKLPSEISDIIDQMLSPDPIERPTMEKVHAIFVGKPKSNTTSKISNSYPSAPKGSVIIHANGKYHVVTQTETITRDLVKANFGNHLEIYSKQFNLFKDNNGDWFIKGLPVPGSAKDSSGKIYKFYRTLYNGEDVTNRFHKLFAMGIVKVGNTQFEIKVNT